MARDGLPTGKGTAPSKLDVADPHPSDEAGNSPAHPGGANAPHDDIGANSYTNTGKAPPRPRHKDDTP
jgi:hypothetical protein